MSGRKPKAGLGFAVGLILLIIADLSTTSYISLTKDGYQNVVVSIEEDSDFSGCQDAIEKVKELVRSTSTSFGKALPDKQAFFGNVTIILPDSWVISDPACFTLLTSTNVSALHWARTHKADMQITADHPVFGWQPYSFQYGGCQKPGLPISVPSSFLTSNTVLAKGNRMAREWAHFRYGVFDEGGMPDDSRHPSGYMMYQTESSDLVVRANTCSDNKTPSGRWNDDECSQSTANSSCEYVADINNPGIQSSLMYRPDLDQMEKFCTKDNHDDGVPSKLSYYCGRFSASEVIYKHTDFMTPGVSPANLSAEITFNIIQNPFSGYHVILDMGSFVNETMFEVAKASLMQFVNFLLDPVRLSIDYYDATGVVEFQAPVFLDYNVRESIIANLVELKWGGSVSSGNFYKALEAAQSRANDGQDIVILTAVKGSITDLTKWIDIYREQKINVHLVYFEAATNQLLPIAPIARYGSLHFLPNLINNPSTSLYTWATNTMQSIYSRTKSHRAKIAEQPVLKSDNNDFNKTGSFYLDGPSSRLLVSLYYLRVDDTVRVDSFTLMKPNGATVIVPSTDVSVQDEFYTLAVESADGELLDPGLWRFEITLIRTAVNRPMRLDIWAESANSSFVELRTWNSASDNQALDFSKGPVGLYAQLTLDKKPVRWANVTAAVYASDNSGTSTLVAEIPLKDEGIADVTSGDGIYSGWMTSPSNSSVSYSVIYRAYGINSWAQIDNGKYDRAPTTGSVIPMMDPDPVAPQFNRFAYGPSFQLSSLPSNSDSIPPQRITDLSVVSYDPTSRKLVLGWTAAKDNYGTGDTIIRYRLERVLGSEVNLGQPETLSVVDGLVNKTVDVPSVSEGQYVKYRVWGVDSFNNAAETSNVVTLAGPAPPTGGLSTAAMWGLIGAGIAILLIILIIVLIRCCCPVEARRKRRQATRKMRQCFSRDKSDSSREEPTSRYQPPPVLWQSPSVRDAASPRRESGSSSDERPVSVEIRQKTVDPSSASTRGSERIYFGQEDIERMTNGPRSETYSERGTEELVKRAPSMDLQLATILRMNSSNMTVDRVGLDEPRREEIIKPARVYARPNKPNQAGRPATVHNQPLSQSETNLYYTDVPVRMQTARSTPSNSYMNVYAERAEVMPQQQLSPRSSLAQTLRAGLRNDEWQDSNSFIYTDPRFDAQSRGSSFDPQLHPANQVGLPPALPSGPPPLLPRSYVDEGRTSQLSMESGLDQPYYPQPMMAKSPSKPSLVSAV